MHRPRRLACLAARLFPESSPDATHMHGQLTREHGFRIRHVSPPAQQAQRRHGLRLAICRGTVIAPCQVGGMLSMLRQRTPMPHDCHADQAASSSLYIPLPPPLPTGTTPNAPVTRLLHARMAAGRTHTKLWMLRASPSP